MSTPTWASPLSFDGLVLDLTDLDLMADLDPYWIGWAAEAAAAGEAAADEVAS